MKTTDPTLTTLDSDLELSVNGLNEKSFISLNKSKKFFLVVRNNSDFPITEVEVHISGSPEVKILSSIKYLGTLRFNREKKHSDYYSTPQIWNIFDKFGSKA